MQHFGQLLVERPVKVPQDLFRDGQHGSQVSVGRLPGVGRWTSRDLRLDFFCQRSCKTHKNTSHPRPPWPLQIFPHHLTNSKGYLKCQQCISGALSKGGDALGGDHTSAAL